MKGGHGSYSFCAWDLSLTPDTSSEREIGGHLSALDARNREGGGLEDSSDSSVCSESGEEAIPCVKLGWMLVTSSQVSAGVDRRWD